jgi:D-glucuronyl C5-epimerase C-terminus
LPGKLKYALRTLYEEVAEFRFDYPLMAVPEAGPKDSLYYYVYKYDKTPPHRRVLRLDPNGVARAFGRTTGVVYRPAFVAMYGMGNLNQYLRSGNQEYLSVFLNQIDWLERHAVVRADGAVVWTNDFNLQDGPLLLRAPWVSANVQGLVISALVRGWRITRRPHLLKLLNGSARVFELDCGNNGIRVQAEGHVVSTETPGLPAPGIMDGFMTALLGLHDLYVETGNPKVSDLFMLGVEGLGHFLSRWDYRKKWSLYGNKSYLCSPAYHCLNRILLTILARVTGDSRFAEYAEAWNPDQLSTLDRTEIYLAFLLSKNACRLKYRTWRQKTNVSTTQLATGGVLVPSMPEDV